MSGSRNAPPISINSPRDTGTSLRRASVLRVSKTAAALLFTTTAASAPVSRCIQLSMCEFRSPRLPLFKSNSRLLAWRATAAIAVIASSGMTARPRFVCRTVPVRLKTGRSEGVNQSCSRSATCEHISDSASSAAPSPCSSKARRDSFSVSRIASVTMGRPCSDTSGATAVQPSTRSTEGSAATEETFFRGICQITRIDHRDRRGYRVHLLADKCSPERRPPWRTEGRSGSAYWYSPGTSMKFPTSRSAACSAARQA